MISLIKMKGVKPQTKEVIYFPRWTRVSTITETQLSKRKDFPKFGRQYTFLIRLGECKRGTQRECLAVTSQLPRSYLAVTPRFRNQG